MNSLVYSDRLSAMLDSIRANGVIRTAEIFSITRNAVYKYLQSHMSSEDYVDFFNEIELMRIHLSATHQRNEKRIAKERQERHILAEIESLRVSGVTWKDIASRLGYYDESAAMKVFKSYKRRYLD